MIKVQNNVATREPLHPALPHDPASLLDLSWTPEHLGLRDVVWLPEDDQTPPLGENQVFDGLETLTPDTQAKTVIVVRGIRDLTPEEVQARWEQENPAPAECKRRQGLLALLSYGIKRSDIEAQIETIEDETERESAWIEYLADTWELGNPRLQAMWAALGGTPEQLPDLFRLAVTL